MKNQFILASSAIGLLMTANAGPIQTSAVKPTVTLERVDIPGTNRELGFGIAEFSPNTSKPKQKATGPEVCYVLEGEVTVWIKGKPPKEFRAGQTWRMPAGVVHQTTAGPAGAKVLASWVHTPGEAFNRVLAN